MNPIDTHENVADLFTKPLEHKKFWYFTQQAMGDYISDTHAHLIIDLAKQNARAGKRSNGGSALTYDHIPRTRNNIIKTALNTVKHLLGQEGHSTEHTSLHNTSSCYTSFAAFEHEQIEKSRSLARKSRDEQMSRDRDT